MKFYSETLKQLFNTEAELVKAEKAEKAKLEKAEQEKKALAEGRAKRAKEVEEAYKAADAAHTNYINLRNKFVEDYGSFHMTINEKTPLTHSDSGNPFRFFDFEDIFDFLH